MYVAADPLCWTGSQESCGAGCPQQGRADPGPISSKALALEAPEPCLSSSSQCSASSSATSGILNSVLLRWGCWGNSGGSRKLPSRLLVL